MLPPLLVKKIMFLSKVVRSMVSVTLVTFAHHIIPTFVPPASGIVRESSFDSSSYPYAMQLPWPSMKRISVPCFWLSVHGTVFLVEDQLYFHPLKPPGVRHFTMEQSPGQFHFSCIFLARNLLSIFDKDF